MMAFMLCMLAIAAGAAIAIQAAMNAQLGVLLNSAMFATGVAFLTSFTLVTAVLVFTSKSYPSVGVITNVPWYLWLAGIFSAFGVSCFYYLIPKMGLGSMMSFALSGQIVVAMLASHLGWFNLPVKALDGSKLLGTVLLIGGVILVNWESRSGY
ncbi:DMT family transporter [Pseudoalteromonas sp. T1lg22]|uniref:DMT family transporter n=1 Tax=Pseudoalteromonas sp. T1lg22 TaxID=2077096 RepID=UPI001F2795C2|nr:DMT family transporter [Pseudoalteromonas sp. T1lg22]